MKPARYIFLNRGLKMSSGKCAAQAAHAETLAMHDMHSALHKVQELAPEVKGWLLRQEELYDKWYWDGHYAKYVMKANDSVQMHTIERYLIDRGFRTYMVIDEGHTEETWMVPTALAIELIDKDDERTGEVFSNFRMYRDPKPEPSVTRVSKGSYFPFLQELKRLRECNGTTEQE